MSKTILITGSSTGIGRAAAMKFQQEGWNVVATMRSPEKEAELNKLDNVLVTRLDVQDLESIGKAISEGVANFGKIDVVLNNAGYGLMGTFESASRESVARQFGGECNRPFRCYPCSAPAFQGQQIRLVHQCIFDWRENDLSPDAALPFYQICSRRLQ